MYSLVDIVVQSRQLHNNNKDWSIIPSRDPIRVIDHIWSPGDTVNTGRVRAASPGQLGPPAPGPPGASPEASPEASPKANG